MRCLGFETRNNNNKNSVKIVHEMIMNALEATYQFDA